jgi:hypothetical protein
MADIYVTWNEAKMIMTCIYLLRNKYSSNLEIQYINKTLIFVRKSTLLIKITDELTIVPTALDLALIPQSSGILSLSISSLAKLSYLWM